jgi:hypothetical protein
MDWFKTRSPMPRRRSSDIWNQLARTSLEQMLLDLEDDTDTVLGEILPSIFKLPRELRDIIYDFLWQDVILAFQQDSFIVVARYRSQNINQPPHTFPVWLSVCRQMRGESIEKFHATAHFSIGEIDRLPAYGHRYYSEVSMAWTSVLSHHMGVQWSSDNRPFSVFTIKEIHSDLLDLKFAKQVTISDLEIEWSVLATDRTGCHHPFLIDCEGPCCDRIVGVAIKVRESPIFSQVTPLLDFGEDGVQTLELSIASGYLPWSSNNVKEILYDWSCFDELPSCVGAVTIEPRIKHWQPAMAITKIRRKCRDFSSSRPRRVDYSVLLSARST